MENKRSANFFSESRKFTSKHIHMCGSEGLPLDPRVQGQGIGVTVAGDVVVRHGGVRAIDDVVDELQKVGTSVKGVQV